MRPRAAAGLGVLVALAVLLAACGPPGAAARPWRGLLKVGLILPFHSAAAPSAMASHVAVRQRLIEANRAGGVAGYRLELVSLDDEGSPTLTARRARELVADPLVVVVLAPAAPALESELAHAGLRLRPLAEPAAAPGAIDDLIAELTAAAATGRVDRTVVRAAP